MTLAAILLLGLSFHCHSFLGAAWAQSAQTTPTSSSASPQDQEQQKTSPPPQPEKSSATSTHQGTAKQPATAKRTHSKKKASSACGALPASAGAGGTSGAQGATSPNSVDKTSSSQATDAKPCAPPKIVVRHGGTSEPSIQLAGGPPSDQTAQQKNVVNQLLGSTEENLKKISERQLTADQQSTVAQIRQFMDQSKAATSDGDMERARTLAWKAQTLSQDLVNPQK